MDEHRLTKVLNLDSPPLLSPASLVGYSTKMWGPYPALIDGPPGNTVNGMVYEVQREDHEKLLADSETDAYRSALCYIRPGEGGKGFFGKTFVWAGDPNDEELSAGNFDFGAWKKVWSVSSA